MVVYTTQFGIGVLWLAKLFYLEGVKAKGPSDCVFMIPNLRDPYQ